MKTLTLILRVFSIAITVILQQGLVIGLGILFYSQQSTGLAILFWCLTIPMIYLNYLTAKNIMKYGLINFITMNADTSEIDVPKGKRWYDEKDSN